MLPFKLLQLQPKDERELETDEDFEKMEVWAADVQDKQHIKPMISWAAHSGLITPELDHLRSVRKTESDDGNIIISLLLSRFVKDESFPFVDSLPSTLSAPYVVTAPKYPSQSQAQLKIKNPLWPCSYAPRKPPEAEMHVWSDDELEWVHSGIAIVAESARAAQSRGELGIASFVSSYEHRDVQFLAHDSRRTTHHPLHHSVINTIRLVADHHTSTDATSPGAPLPDQSYPQSPLNREPSTGEENYVPQIPKNDLQNGDAYLLTHLTLFTTHEPCIMCSMALVHSRVARIFFIQSMPSTGGCGGCAAITGLNGVNHRYDVFQWTDSTVLNDVSVDQSIDA